MLLSSRSAAFNFGIYSQLASLVPREKYLYCAPHSAAEHLGLHIVNHSKKDTLQKF